MYENKKEVDFKTFALPDKCGVRGCDNPCDIYIFSRKVSRCTKHYCQDLSDHQHGGTTHVLGRFHAERDILDKLVEVGMKQTPDESMKEYAARCKNYLKTMGNGYSRLVSG